MRWRGLMAMALVLTSCAHRRQAAPELAQLIKDGQLMTARERIDLSLKATPGDAKLKAFLQQINATIAQLDENVDFNPIKYLYSQAYLNYFERKRYGKAAEDLAQILAYAMENREIIDFMEKTQPLAREERLEAGRKLAAALARSQSLFDERQYAPALEAARMALLLDPASQAAKDLVEKALSAMRQLAIKIEPPVEAIAPDPEQLEDRYVEAIKAYLRGDLAQSRLLLAENMRQDPQRAKWRKTLRRVENEMPRDRLTR